jgi:competence protein ComEA
MITPDERRALVFLAAVTALGAAVRAARPAGDGATAAAVAPELAGGDLVRQAAASQRAESLARPLGAEERVDLNQAPVEELDRLPRVGPALARRIVEDRAANGPYRTLADLARVTGVGPRLLRELEPHVSFAGVPPLAAVPPPLAAVPAPPDRAARPACPDRLAVNRATAAELTCLPGIGPVLAERVVGERTAHGPFRDIGDLARVPGLGPKRIARLANRLTIP